MSGAPCSGIRPVQPSAPAPRNFLCGNGLFGAVLDHADEQMRSMAGSADLQPAHGNSAPAADRIFDGVDDRFELLLQFHQLTVAPFDHIGGLRGKQFARGLADDLAARHADHHLGRPVDEDVAQALRILCNDALRDVFDDGGEELLGPLQDAAVWFRAGRSDKPAGNLPPARSRVDLDGANLAVRKLIEFDDDTFDKLKQLARDRMGTIQELADEAFADLLKKHGIPIDLKDALRKSAAGAAAAEPRQPRRRSASRSGAAKKKS